MIVKFRNKIILGIVLIFLSFLLLGYGSVLYKGSLDNVFRVLRDINSSIIPLDYLHLLKDEVGTKASQLGFLVNKGIRVPEGFLIRKEVHDYYKEHKGISDVVWEKMIKQIQILEEKTGLSFNDEENPLLVSVRSAPPETMPGILATVLNVGVNDKTVKGLVEKGGLYFGYDTYRRFIEGFVKVVFRDRVKEDFFVDLQNNFLEKRYKKSLEKLDGEEMEELVRIYQQELKTQKDIVVPQDVYEQLKMSIEAVFSSWDLPVAQEYKKDNSILDDAGMSILIQRMVFGNLNQKSGAGVAFFGKVLKHAKIKAWMEAYYRIGVQGDDIMTPQSYQTFLFRLSSPFNPLLSEIYSKLAEISSDLRDHYDKPQEIEYVFENGRLYVLQVSIAQSLLNDEEFLIQRSFSDPTGAITILQGQSRRISERNWQVYKAVEFTTSSTSSIISRGESLSSGVVKGTLCLSLDEVERVYAQGGIPILLYTRRDDKVVKAMCEGKIAGLIATFGNIVMHETVIADIYVIPGVLIKTSEAGTLRSGEEIIVYGGRLEGYVIKPTTETELSGVYQSSSEILNLDFDSFSEEVRQEYRDYSLKEIVLEHMRLVSDLWEKIRYYSETFYSHEIRGSQLIEEILLLNLKTHFLHQLIFKEQERHGISDDELKEMFIETIRDKSSPSSVYIKYSIADEAYELADEAGLRLIAVDRITDTDTASITPSIENSLAGRYFVSKTSYDLVTLSSQLAEERVREFLEFAKQKLRQRGQENYLRINKLTQAEWSSHSSGIWCYWTLYGIDFPKEKLDEVLELLEEWEKKSN